MPDFVKDQGYHGVMALSGTAQSWYKKVTGKVIEMSSGYIAAYSRPAALETVKGRYCRCLTALLHGTCPSYEFDYNASPSILDRSGESKAQDKIKTIIKPIKVLKVSILPIEIINLLTL